MSVHNISTRIAGASSTYGADATAIYKRLLELKPDETATYAELSKLVGRDVQNEARAALSAARKRAFRQDGLVFRCVIDKGLMRLNDNEIAMSGKIAIPHVRRKLRRIRETVLVAPLENLTDEAKREQLTTVSVCGALEHALSAKGVAKIEAVVANNGSAMPIGHVLEAFKK